MKIFMKYLFLLISLIIMSACGGGGGGDGTPAGEGPGQTQVEPLNFFEEEMAKKWYRYHAYDDTDEYFIFKGDRTACYFEYSSSGSRTNVKNYTSWKLEAVTGSTTVYKIILTTPSGGIVDNHRFHYSLMEVRKGGYSNLAMFPSTTSRDCN